MRGLGTKSNVTCWICQCSFRGHKLLTRHMESVHQRLTIKCPCCEQVIKRSRDFQTHFRKQHADVTPPLNAFTGRYMAPIAVHVDDFIRVFPSDRLSAVTAWWKGLRSGPTGLSVPSTSAHIFKPVDPSQSSDFSLSHVSLKPGNVFAEGQIDQCDFMLHLEDSIFSDHLSLRSLSRRMAALPSGHQHSPSLDELPACFDKGYFHTLAENLGVRKELFASLRMSNISFPAPGTPLQDEQFQVVPDLAHASQASTIINSTSASATASISLDTPLTVPSLTESLPSISMPLVPAVPSEEYRANKLLRFGALPLFPPARRSWDKEEIVFLPLDSQSVAWPPKNWKKLSPDQRLLQVEFLAMRILLVRGQDISCLDRCHLLDQFNFLVLPGSLSYQVPRHDTLLRSCAGTYHQLRQIATGKRKDGMWLTMIESSAMFRDTSNDALIKLCDPVPLRL